MGSLISEKMFCCNKTLKLLVNNLLSKTFLFLTSDFLNLNNGVPHLGAKTKPIKGELNATTNLRLFESIGIID